MLPAFFNYTDSERIKTIVADQAKDFLLKTPKKVLFAIGVKIFSFPNEVCAVRIALAKMFMEE